MREITVHILSAWDDGEDHTSHNADDTINNDMNNGKGGNTNGDSKKGNRERASK